jgi:hypothetical protein
VNSKVATLVVACSAAALVAAGTATAKTAKPAPLPADDATANCVLNGHVPRIVVGNPGRLNPTRRGDIYLWHNAAGWRLRVRHVGHFKVVFGGTITTGNGEKIRYTPFQLEKDDTVTLNGTATQLTFNFKDYGFIDGIDFTTQCAKQLTFDFSRDGNPINPDRVHLGALKLATLSNPFVVQRRAPAA